jgi:hypothetical protein
VHGAESLQYILTELVGAGRVQALKDSPAPSTGMACSIANLASYLHAMLNDDTALAYTKSTYRSNYNSKLLEGKCKPCGLDGKKPQCSMVPKKCKKKKNDDKNEPQTNKWFAEKEDSGSNGQCTGLEDNRKEDTNRWITINRFTDIRVLCGKKKNHAS